MTPEELNGYSSAMQTQEGRRAQGHKQIGDWYIDPNTTIVKAQFGIIGGLGTALLMDKYSLLEKIANDPTVKNIGGIAICGLVGAAVYYITGKIINRNQ